MYEVKFLYTPEYSDQPEQAQYIVGSECVTGEDAVVTALADFHNNQPKGNKIHKSTVKCRRLNNSCARLV